MRRILNVLVVVIALLVGAMPVGRASVVERLTDKISLSGKRTAYIDVTFPERFTLEKEATRFQSDGSFVGWMMHRLGEPFDVTKGNVAGAYVIRDVVTPEEARETFHFNIGFKAQNMAPGRYRVYLLADAPAKVQIPIAKGATGMTLRPRVRTDASVTTAELAVIGGTVNDTKHTPIQVTDRSLTVSSIYFSATQGATVQDVQACVKQEMEPVAGCEEGGIAGYVVHPLGGYTFSLSVFYEPGLLQPGKYFAFQRAIAGVVVQRAVGASLSVDIHSR